MSKRLSGARRCFARECEARTLTIPSELYDELLAICAMPYENAPVLEQRLLRGGEIIVARGDQTAPERLWQRWEAILVAYCCCEDEKNRIYERGRRRAAHMSQQAMLAEDAS